MPGRIGSESSSDGPADLEICAIFLTAPLAAKGLPIARAVTSTLVLAVLVIVVMLSPRTGRHYLDPAGVGATANQPF